MKTQPIQDTIYHEMMAHIPLFAHTKPQHILLIDDNNHGILQEVLKHTNTAQVWHVTDDGRTAPMADARVSYCNKSQLEQFAPSSLDVIIIANSTTTSFAQYLKMLHTDGLLLQQCDSSYQIDPLKTLQMQLISTGFHDVHALLFAQPEFTSGLRTAVIAIKQGMIRRPREKDIFNKSFDTYYYNLDMHKAAFALPEFMREELIEA